MAEAFDIQVLDITREAAADLSTKQYLAVKVDSNGQAAVAGAGEFAIGVLQNNPSAQGQAASVRVLGVTRMVAGGVVNPGALVAADANGKAKAATLGAGSSSNVLGVHLGTSAAAANDLIPVLLTQTGAAPTTPT